MGEAEYLDGEMPQEDESETPQTEKANEGCQESSNMKDLQESAAKDDFSKEKTGEDGEKDTDKEKKATHLHEDNNDDAEKDGDEADAEDEDDVEKPEDEDGTEEGDEAIEEDEDALDEDEDPNEEVEEIEPDFETGTDAEGELITGDEPGDLADVPIRERKKEEPVDEDQCRVCTSKEELVCLFKKQIDATPADMLLVICPNVSILPKDFMPQFICTKCMGSLTIAIQLRKQLETTDQSRASACPEARIKCEDPAAMWS